MDAYEEEAAEIIDDVCDSIEAQHPEIKLKTKITKEVDIDDPALICGDEYYSLEEKIAERLKTFFEKIKYIKYI